MKKTAIHTLELHNISLGYIPGQFLLQDVSAVAGAGELIALVGRNGSGKSTLLRTIAGLRKQEAGEVNINDPSTGKPAGARMEKVLAYIGTSVNAMHHYSVYEVVSLARHPYTNWWGKLSKEDAKAIHRSLEFVGLESFTHKRMETLSDGERQRVLTAMALAQDTSIILLDEPTAFLDIPNRMEIANVLYKLKQAGKTILFSTHDFETVLQYADRVWLLHQHQLVQGAPEDLGLRGYYDEVFRESGISFDPSGMQFRKEKRRGHAIVFVGGKDVASVWTRQMLGRLGFEILTGSKQREKTAVLEVKGEGDSLFWNYMYQGNQHLFYSVYNLALFLNNQTL